MSGPNPSVSVIVPVLNEESIVDECLAGLLELSPDEVIVADGHSTDHTREIAAGYARVVISEPGRGRQLNAGAAASTGEILLFVHADVRFSNKALEPLRDAMRDAGVIGGNFDIVYEGAPAFTRINRWRRGFGVFYGDSGIFCRRTVFNEIGGYRDWPVLEDYEFGRRLWKRGKLALLDEPIIVSARRWRKTGLPATLWSWFWIQGLYLLGVSPHRLARMYRDVR